MKGAMRAGPWVGRWISVKDAHSDDSKAVMWGGTRVVMKAVSMALMTAENWALSLVVLSAG
jgi:hypothetical protein